MKTYIYPENLRANVKLWFWSVRDFIIICGGIILSVVILVNFWNVLPFAAIACFAFLSLRVDETAIMDYIFNAVKFFMTSHPHEKFVKQISLVRNCLRRLAAYNINFVKVKTFLKNFVLKMRF